MSTLGRNRTSTPLFAVSATHTRLLAAKGVVADAPTPPNCLVDEKTVATGRLILTMVSVVAVVASITS